MPKKHKCPEYENHERWLVSYADMVTLLFAVFVVLYAIQISGQRKSKKSQVSQSMQESFNKPMEDIPVDRRIGPTQGGLGIFDFFRGDSATVPLTQKYPLSAAQIKVLELEMKQTKSKLEERMYGPQKHRSGSKPGQARIVSVVRTAKGFKLQLLARHFYAPGGTTIRKAALKDLDTIIKSLKELGRPVAVEGHTDSVPPKGKKTNWELSALRATHVLQYMIRKHQFPATTLSAAGYADMRPIAHNGTENGRMLNRRIELHVDYQGSMTPE